ncbi:hypothetical protein IFM89_005686 [Coptis chinensis]|uniref:Cytochrome P450 n=1 Tax=Coptis chinensis TaxID=261450 RepID=A0A835GVY2_9MAGN|nr:hypothetical protein IFM89_005686 [Coptis chinensis]
MEVAFFFTAILLPLPVVLFLLIKTTRRHSSNRLPPGSLGIPIVGHSIAFIRARKANRFEKWIEDRANKYGPVSKLTLFGTPTVFIHGQAANKFVFNSYDTLNTQQPQAMSKILGETMMLGLGGEDHTRVKGAIMTFLKPEALKQYVGKIDGEVREHLGLHWQGKPEVTSLWSVPVNLPFTRFNRGLRASSRTENMLKEIISEKRLALEKQQVSPSHDLITSLISARGIDNASLLSEKEIVDNVRFVMLAGYDTAAVLITLFIRFLASDPVVHAAILREQEEIAKSKASGDFITWEDINKMKYTWSVAMEILRIYPPVIGVFRRTLKDIEYEGYLIPKGWQVFITASMTHMNKEIFPEPSKVVPKRFENQALVPPYCFMPFGGGSRMCPGNEFAKITTLVVMHHLVTRFTWKLCFKDEKISRNPMPLPIFDLPIRIEPRKVM